MDTDGFSPIQWTGDAVRLIDQRRLPTAEEIIECTTWAQVADAIRSMVVRGAPAIGITAAYGLVLAAYSAQAKNLADLKQKVEPAIKGLAATRPTAVNLFWALDRMRIHLDQDTSVKTALKALEDEARSIHADDLAMCKSIGEHGADLLPKNARILTHCNAGALATGGYGTALGVIRSAHQRGELAVVYADETRPFLQGARLTAWELAKDGIPVRVITDNMAAHFMQRGQIDAVVVGTDRVAANGDIANKIGTYGLAVLAKYHGIPFFVAGPSSTIDLKTATGKDIPIERRPDREVTHVGPTRLVPEMVPVENPAFDITPAELITAIITEHGVARAPYEVLLPNHVRDGR